MSVLCCVVLYDFVHCLLLRRNNKYNILPVHLFHSFVRYQTYEHSISKTNELTFM